MEVPANVYDVTQPPDTQLANLLGLDLRNLALNVQQRMGLISGTFANMWNPGADAQPLNWTGLLYFATDTGQIFQWSGAAWVNITASFIVPSGASYVTAKGLGAPNIVATVSLTGVAGNINSTLLYSVPVGAAGLYRVTAETVLTTIGTGGTIQSELVRNNGILQTTYSFGTLATALVAGANSDFPPVTFYSAASEPINYFVVFNGTTGAPQCSIYYRVEYLG